MACSGAVIVVSPTKRAGRVSSIPATETCSGTLTPASRRRISTPIAASSLAATTACGQLPAREQALRGGDAVLVGEAAGHAVAAARAVEARRSRCALVCRLCGPSTNTMSWWPSERT